MALFFYHTQEYIYINGHTFPYKEAIKSLGGRFDGQGKRWIVPFSDESLTKVENLCASTGGGKVVEKASSPPPSQSEDPPLTSIPNVSPGNSLELRPGDYTVASLMSTVAQTISARFSQPVWVVGEIENLSARGRTGLFFSLAQKETRLGSSSTMTVNCTLWNRQISLLSQKHQIKDLSEVLQDGLQIRLLCQVSFYQGRGSLSLNILDFDQAYVLGSIALERQRVLAELRKKGYDQLNKSLELAKFPFAVGLVTAPGSRAYSDFVDQLLTSGFCGQVIFAPASMQGESVCTSVPSALKVLQDKVDVIVMTRGGGSAADLRWFDHKEVALAVAKCKVPVVCAIGHHEDICIAEEISYVRQKTPTAAAEYILNCFRSVADHIDRLIAQLGAGVDERFYRERDREIHLRQKLASAWRGTLAKFESEIEETSLKIGFSARRRLDGFQFQLLNLEKKLLSLDPRPWLKKGWTQVFKGKKLVKSIGQVQLNDQVHIRLLDGKLDLTIHDISQSEGQPNAKK